MKKFVFIYTLSFILCISPFINAEELSPAIDSSVSGTEGEIAADTGNVTGGALELPSSTGDLTTDSAILLPSDDTTGSGVVFIPEMGVPGGAVIVTNPEALSTTGAGIMTTPEAIIPADITKLELLAAQAAAAGSGGYMVMTVTPTSYDMGVLNFGSTYTYTGAAVLNITTKSVWNLQVSGTDFSNGTDTIPVSRIKYKVSTSSEYKTLSSVPIDLLTNQSKTWPKTTTVQIDYQITILPTDPVGTNFQNNLTFTLY